MLDLKEQGAKKVAPSKIRGGATGPISRKNWQWR